MANQPNSQAMVKRPEEPAAEPVSAYAKDWAALREQALVLFNSGFLPAAITKAEQCIAVIMQGRELGVDPMAALRGIHIINGTPMIAPQLGLGLCIRTGEVEQNENGHDDDGTAWWTIKRRGRAAVTVRFGKKEADAMKLSEKPNYKMQAKTMYGWRALGAVLRQTFPDVLFGLYVPLVDEIPDHDFDPPAEAASEFIPTDSDAGAIEAEFTTSDEPATVSTDPNGKPSTDEFAKLTDELWMVCKHLNNAGDQIRWSPATMKNHVNGMYLVSDGLHDLNIEQFEDLRKWLSLRLDGLASAAEKAA